MHARSHLADALSNSGRIDDAVAEYESILSLDPEDPQGLLGLGRLKLYALQDIGGGVEAWEKLLEVAPSSPEANSIRDELEALQSAHVPQ
jgi:tetratricopeptide (TPR) repeat protein